MSKLKNTFGFTSSLLDTIKNVYEAAKAPGTEAREKIKNVPREEGDEDLRARQGEIQRKIVDEAKEKPKAGDLKKPPLVKEQLKGGQHKIDVAAPKGKITAADFAKLRSMKKEEVEPLEELSKSAKERLKNTKERLEKMYGKPKADSKEAAKATSTDTRMKEEVEMETEGAGYSSKYPSSAYTRNYSYKPKQRSYDDDSTSAASKRYAKTRRSLYDRADAANPSHATQKEEVEQIDEADKTYPYKASQLTPIMIQLRSLIKFLSRSGVLKSLMMREHYALYEVYMEQEFDADELDSLLEEIEDLLEGRPKGSKNKSKLASAPAPAAKKSDDDEDEEEEAPAYKPASGKDVEHVMPQLAGAVDAKDSKHGGRHITTAKGSKFVSSDTAAKIHKHLMGLKAPDRAEASSKIYHMDDSHPAVKAINSDHEAAVKRGIQTPGEKKGRGRPKKTA